VNEIECRFVAGRPVVSGLDTSAFATVHLPNGPARLYVRPHDLEMEASADGRALVRFVSPIGAVVRSEVELPEGQLVEVMQMHERFEQQPLQPGDRVVLTAKRGQVFPPAS